MHCSKCIEYTAPRVSDNINYNLWGNYDVSI